MQQVDLRVADVNRRAYSLPAIVDNYAGSHSLDAAEQWVLERFRDRIAGKAVLDLGCGAGRTTPALAALAASYDGVDVAEPMVTHCRARFPMLRNARFHVMDARSLPEFADASFDFILFSFNGIDCVAHHGRLAVLQEARRLLRPDGVFAFSTHNRGYAGLERRPRMPRSPAARPWASYARNLLNSLRLRGHEVSTDEYEIVNDAAEGFRLLCYHATAAANARQIAAAGLRLLDTLDHKGRSIAPTGNHPDVPFLMFVATR